MNLTDRVSHILIANTGWVMRSHMKTELFEPNMNYVLKKVGYDNKLRERMLYAALLPEGVNAFAPVDSYYGPALEGYYTPGNIQPVNTFNPYQMSWEDFFDVLLNTIRFKEIEEYRVFMLKFYADRMLVMLRVPGYGSHRVILVTPYAYVLGKLKVGEFW